MSKEQNIIRIKTVYKALEELATQVVFVGGATVSLYSTRPESETRPTEDVDIVIELIHYKDYAAVEEKLRSKGFENDIHSRVICRYKVRGITVDVMPTSSDVLGFANKWYQKAYEHAIWAKIDEDLSVRIFSPPYFLATKLEAFKDRGKGDGRLSTDFEDIIHVLNNRSMIWTEMNDADNAIKQYLKGELATLLQLKYIEEWVGVHLEYHERQRAVGILQRISEFVTED